MEASRCPLLRTPTFNVCCHIAPGGVQEHRGASQFLLSKPADLSGSRAGPPSPPAGAWLVASGRSTSHMVTLTVAGPNSHHKPSCALGALHWSFVVGLLPPHSRCRWRIWLSATTPTGQPSQLAAASNPWCPAARVCRRGSSLSAGESGCQQPLPPTRTHTMPGTACCCCRPPRRRWRRRLLAATAGAHSAPGTSGSSDRSMAHTCCAWVTPPSLGALGQEA